MSNTTNYLGGAVFWLYIVAALAIATIIIYTIATLSNTTTANDADRRKAIRVFAALATLSFSTLSFNMLHVLVQSFNLWSTKRSIPRPSSSTALLQNVRDWSFSSNLFLDFGEAIVYDEPRTLWTQTALMATFSVCLFMASEGRRRNIPHLWAFFALSQILPISFAQNLFYITLLRSPALPASRTVIPLTAMAASIWAYAICLVLAPLAAQYDLLIPTILAARAMLILPLVLPKRAVAQARAHSSAPHGWKTAASGHTLIIGWTTLCWLKQFYSIVEGRLTITDVGSALLSHPAVTSLGADLFVGMFSFAIWRYTQQHLKRMEIDAKVA